jgi:hypothetical protein
MDWLLFVYKVPPEPSARRVYVWRKLKRLGAVLLHDAVWVLPDNARTREQLQWLSGEIMEMQGGDALLWQSQPLLPNIEQRIRDQFAAQTNAEYRDILDALDQPEADLADLSRRYQQAVTRDYFQSEISAAVRNALLAKRGGSI